jgi:hypothetical protein
MSRKKWSARCRKMVGRQGAGRWLWLLVVDVVMVVPIVDSVEIVAGGVTPAAFE